MVNQTKEISLIRTNLFSFTVSSSSLFSQQATSSTRTLLFISNVTQKEKFLLLFKYRLLLLVSILILTFIFIYICSKYYVNLKKLRKRALNTNKHLLTYLKFKIIDLINLLINCKNGQKIHKTFSISVNNHHFQQKNIGDEQNDEFRMVHLTNKNSYVNKSFINSVGNSLLSLNIENDNANTAISNAEQNYYRKYSQMSSNNTTNYTELIEIEEEDSVDDNNDKIFEKDNNEELHGVYYNKINRSYIKSFSFNGFNKQNLLSMYDQSSVCSLLTTTTTLNSNYNTRHNLPLIMITDTTSLQTDIIDLETYNDDLVNSRYKTQLTKQLRHEINEKRPN